MFNVNLKSSALLFLKEVSIIILFRNYEISFFGSLGGDEGLDTVEANHALGYKADMRDYGVGIQILKDLGLSKIRLLTNNPKKTEAFNVRGFNLEVVDQVPIWPPIIQHNEKYLATKREKLGHKIPNENSDSTND